MAVREYFQPIGSSCLLIWHKAYGFERLVVKHSRNRKGLVVMCDQTETSLVVMWDQNETSSVTRSIVKLRISSRCDRDLYHCLLSTGSILLYLTEVADNLHRIWTANDPLNCSFVPEPIIATKLEVTLLPNVKCNAHNQFNDESTSQTLAHHCTDSEQIYLCLVICVFLWFRCISIQPGSAR